MVQQMNNIKVCITKYEDIRLPSEIIRWHLEEPKATDTFSEKGLKVRGWIASRHPGLKVGIREKGTSTWITHTLSERRSDVIKKILKEPPTGHPQLECGFCFNVDSQNFEIGILFDQAIFWVANIYSSEDPNNFLKNLDNRLQSITSSLPLQASSYKFKLGVLPEQHWDEVRTTEKFIIKAQNDAKIVKSGTVKLIGIGYAIADGADCHIFISPNAQLNGTKIKVKGKGSSIFIGPNCRLKNVQIAITGDNCLVIIGAGTTWESGTGICQDGKAILIGDDCMFSNQVIIRTSDGHSIWEAGGTRRISMPDNVIIGPHVWLGNSARVSKGTIIGRGTIVGQLSLAIGILKENCIYGGLPARLIKENVEWSRTQAYSEIPKEYLLQGNHKI